MEPSLPSVPTDNLYKFMALGGLACVVAFFWFFGTRIPVEENEIARLEGEAAVLNYKALLTDVDATNLDTRLSKWYREADEFVTNSTQWVSNALWSCTNETSLLHQLAAVPTNQAILTNGAVSIAVLRSLVSDLRDEREKVLTQQEKLKAKGLTLQNEADQIRNRHREGDLGRLEVQNKAALIKAQNASLKRVLLLARVCVPASGLFSFLGFVLWYYRIQRYQDSMLKKEAESKPPSHRTAKTGGKNEGE